MIGSTFIAGGFIADSGQASQVDRISFDPVQIWPGFSVDATHVAIDLDDINVSSAHAHATTGDYRQVLYRILLSAGTFYENQSWDQQARTGKVRVFDTYAFNHAVFGQVLRRMLVSKIHINVTHGDVAGEPDGG